MTLQEELSQWIKNYEVVKTYLSAAFLFKNEDAVDEFGKRLITTQRQIAEIIAELEKDGNTNSNNTVGTSISPSVKARKDSTLNLNSKDRNIAGK